MAYNSPRSISVRIALLISLVVFATFLAFNYVLHNEVDITAAIVLAVVSFIFSWLVSSFFLEKFLYQKVKVIYKTIHNFKRVGTAENLKIRMQEDVLEEVSKDVQAWTSDKLGKIEHLESQEVFRREFIGNLSHELKTPVFNIQGYILTLLDGALDDPEHNKVFLRKAAKSVDRIAALLEDLDSISRIEENVLELELEKFDIVSVVKEVFDLLEEASTSNKVELRLKNSNQKPEYVMADKDKITQVITNLLVNSIKYGNENGYTEVRFYDMDESILIEVKDNGIGIAEKHLSRLFERFYRVDKSRSRHIGGTGLGLAIVKHMIEAHDHNISVISQPGKGSTFSFTLSKS